MQKRVVFTALFTILAFGVRVQSLSAHSGDQAGASIAAEAFRLKGVLASLKLPAAEQETFTTQFNRIERAVQAGHVFLSLYLLQQPASLLPAYEYQKTKTEVEKSGLEAFEQEWRRLGSELNGKERRLTAAPAHRLPLAVKAIIERSLTQVQPHYQSGRLYGQQTTVDSGLFYLGLAKAQLEFALFCRSLDVAAAGAAAPLRSLAPELEALEREVLEAYRRLGATDKQSTFIRINASLKVAQDLEKEQRFSGALLQYLEVCRALDAVGSAPAESSAPDALNPQSESFRAQLSGSRMDHSIGWLYWQMAQAAMEPGGGGVNDQRGAAVILHRVLPRYFKYMARVKR